MRAPIFPRVNTLAGRTLARLIERGDEGMTHRGLDVVARSYRLSGYIHSIRAMGWPIETKMFSASVRADGGRPVHIARYLLAPEVWQFITPAEAFDYLERVKAWEKRRKGTSQAPGTTHKAQDGKPLSCAGCPFGQYNKRGAK